MKVLNLWIQRGVLGAKTIKNEVGAMNSDAEKFAFLRSKVVPNSHTGRPQQPDNTTAEDFNPSEGTQITGVSIVKLQLNCVKKTFRTASPSCKRTLAIYAMLRKMNLETAAPVATLLKVENEGTYTHMHFQ